jgi:hypothetical protein
MGVWKAGASPNQRVAAEGDMALGLSTFGMKCAGADQDASRRI